MKKTNNILFYLSIFTTVILVFFGNKIGNLNIIKAIACILAIFSINIKNIKIKKDSFFWILAGIVTIFTIFTSQNREVSMFSAISITMAIIIKIIYENHQGWQKNFIKIMTIASGIHVFATIIQLLFPNIITTINRVLLTTEGFTQNQEFYSRGVYAGLNDQTAPNAYFIAIFIGIIFIKIITNKENKSINVTLLMIAIVALFITAKRGILLFTLASMFFVFIYLLNKNKKDILKYLITLVIIVSVGYIVIINVPETQIVLITI